MKKTGSAAKISVVADPIPKKENFFFRHRYFFVFLFFLYLYNFCVTTSFEPWSIDTVTFENYILNYSFGFCTKFLPGAVAQLFIKNPTYENTSVYESILLMIAVIGICVLLDSFVRSVSKEYKKTVLLLLVFYLTGSCTFSMFFLELGMLDGYWMYFAVLFIFLLQSKYLRPILPVLFALTILVHYSTILNYIPFFALLILYEISFLEKKRERIVLWIVFVVSVAISFVGFAYFLVHERDNLTYKTAEDFNAVLKEHGAQYTIYFDYTFFDDYSFLGSNYSDPKLVLSGTFLPVGVENIINAVIRQIHFCFLMHMDTDYMMIYTEIAMLLCVAPLLFVLYKGMIRYYNQCKVNRLLRFALVCTFFLPPLTFLGGFLSSVDPRWVGHSFLPFFTLYLYLIWRSKDRGILDELKREITGIPSSILVGYLLIYMIFIFHPYMLEGGNGLASN